MKQGAALVAVALALACSLVPISAAAAPGNGGGKQHAKTHGRSASTTRAAVIATPPVAPTPVPAPVPVPVSNPVAAKPPAPAPAAAVPRLPLVIQPAPPVLEPIPPAPEPRSEPQPRRGELAEIGAAPAVVVVPVRELPGFLPPLLAALLGGLLLLGAVLFWRQRRQRSRRDAIERGKLDFLLLASHELRTPLSVLAGYVSMAEDGSLGPLPVAAQEALPDMEEKVGEMQAKLDQILLAVSASYGRLDLAPRRVRARELVAAAVERAVEHGHQRDRFRVFGDRDAVAYCDPDHTVLTLSSLLDNAAKFSPPTAPVTCFVERPLMRSRVEITVGDRGPGIADDVKAILFSRFGRVAGPRDSHLSGAGLGLYLAREMARAQGGDVVLGETSERGSEFVLRLPA